MGVPVSGKNLFPSNIAGLPTWFTIRANQHGYIARKKGNRLPRGHESRDSEDDVMSLAPGRRWCMTKPLKLNELRTDLVFYSVPYDKILTTVGAEAKVRKLVKNMIYVGVVAQILDII